MSEAVRGVLRLAQPRFGRFAPGLLLGLLSAASSVALLATSAWLITRASEHPPILFLSAAIVGVRAFALARAGFHYAERLASHDAAFRQLGELRVGIYRRLVPLAPDGLGDVRRGDLLSRLVTDVDRLPDLPLRVVQPIVVALATSVLSVIGVALLLPAAAAVLAVALAAAFAVATLAHSAIAGRAERALAPLRGALADRILETVGSLDVLIAFDAIDDRLAAVDEASEQLTRATVRRALGAGATSAILAILAALAVVGSLAVAIGALGSGAIGAPELTVIALVPLAVFEVMGGAPLAVAAWRQVVVSARRVAEAVPAADAPSHRPDAGPRPSPGTGPVIELTDLSVTWPGAPAPAVSGLELRLAPGDRVVLDGATGAGKTTLAHALVGFLPYGGSYRLHGREVSDLAPEQLRCVVGLCEQLPYLFDDDLRQNLLFAKDSADDPELERMLDRVGLGSWARDRNGLDTAVGDAGSLVSGGQAQRIALARALLADFPVIVFDEPTANVETELADQLMRDILSLAGDESRVVVVISHAPVPAELVTRRVMLTAGAPATGTLAAGAPATPAPHQETVPSFD